MAIACLSNLFKLFVIFISQKSDESSLEIDSSGQFALKTENQTLNRFLVQTCLTGIVMLDDHSQEMRCFQNGVKAHCTSRTGLSTSCSFSFGIPTQY